MDEAPPLGLGGSCRFRRFVMGEPTTKRLTGIGDYVASTVIHRSPRPRPAVCWWDRILCESLNSHNLSAHHSVTAETRLGRWKRMSGPGPGPGGEDFLIRPMHSIFYTTVNEA